MLTIILSVCLFLSVCVCIYMSYKYYQIVRVSEMDSLYTHIDNVKIRLDEDINSLKRDTDNRFDELWNRIDN